MSLTTGIPWIHTRCHACGNQGVSPLAVIDRTFDPGIDLVLRALRARCPDCGAGGRDAELVCGEPNEATDSELREIWLEAQAFVASEAAPPRRVVGRNEPCPCGSGQKYKRCCG